MACAGNVVQCKSTLLLFETLWPCIFLIGDLHCSRQVTSWYCPHTCLVWHKLPAAHSNPRWSTPRLALICSFTLVPGTSRWLTCNQSPARPFKFSVRLCHSLALKSLTSLPHFQNCHLRKYYPHPACSLVNAGSATQTDHISTTFAKSNSGALVADRPGGGRGVGIKLNTEP